MTPDVKIAPIKRVIITTRKTEEPKLASLNFTEADVKALNKIKRSNVVGEAQTRCLEKICLATHAHAQRRGVAAH